MVTLLSVCFFTAQLHFHALHISVCEIKPNEKEKSYQIKMKVFLDDLEVQLQQLHPAERIDIISPVDEKKLNHFIESYVLQNLEIYADQQQLSLNYIGHQTENDVMICYIEAINVKHSKKITIRNTTFLQQFPDQMNLVHFIKENKTYTLKLSKEQPTDIIDL